MEQQTQEELFVSCNGVDHFVVDDLLDFSNGDDGSFDAVTDSSSVSVSTFGERCNSSSGCEPSLADAVEFSGDLCVVQCEDLAELEWLSNFVEESFSSEDQDKLDLLSSSKNSVPNPPPQPQSGPEPEPEPEPEPGSIINPSNNNDDVTIPARARSKRSRAAASTWSSAALVTVSNPPHPSNPYSPPGPNYIADVSGRIAHMSAHVGDEACHVPKKKTLREDSSTVAADRGGVRRCLHCAAEKTPQWRTGPMGPKTLCNACGVRYKSGRLVPEYRPAASPTFVLTKHSNSHRKVIELRRQKEAIVQRRREELLTQLRRERALMGDDRSNGEDFLIHQHVGPDFRQLI